MRNTLCLGSVSTEDALGQHAAHGERLHLWGPLQEPLPGLWQPVVSEGLEKVRPARISAKDFQRK